MSGVTRKAGLLFGVHVPSVRPMQMLLSCSLRFTD